ncbi:uncharacterized protein METZ01_LOCUS469340, partial [marine metagenome]
MNLIFALGFFPCNKWQTCLGPGGHA